MIATTEFDSSKRSNNFNVSCFLLLACLVMSASCGRIFNQKEGESALQFAKDLDSIAQSHAAIVLTLPVTHQVLDLSRGSQENNAPVVIYDWNGGGNQFWILEKREKGYLIRSCFSKKVLAVDSDNSLVQQDYTEDDHQLWMISGTMDKASMMNKALHQYLVFKTNKIAFDKCSALKARQWHIKSLQNIQSELIACNCAENFEFVKHMMETSYAGFQDKVNPQTKVSYDQLSALSAEKAKATSNTATCFKTIKNYLRFFNDGHVQFGMNHGSYFQYLEKNEKDQIRKFFADCESVKLSEGEAMAYFESQKKNLDPLEGIWESVGGDYRCAIKSDPADTKHFQAVILKADSLYWMPGQVKMDFQKQADNGYFLYYAAQDHSLMAEQNIKIVGDTLYEWNGKWVKRFPHNLLLSNMKAPARHQNAASFELKNLDDSTLILSLPSFDPSNKERVDQLMSSNSDKLAHCPYLIIDVRGNGGGADETFNSILPYLYTNPYEIMGNDILSSKETIAAYEKMLLHADDRHKEWVQSILWRMKESPGQFVTFFNGTTVRFDQVMPNPRKIGILINGNCGSSAEQFLLMAKESKKLKMFGQPTSGTLDYSNVIRVEQCPSPAFQFGYATTKTRRLPFYSVDKEKIKPDVYLTDTENWMQTAVKQLKN